MSDVQNIKTTSQQIADIKNKKNQNTAELKNNKTNASLFNEKNSVKQEEQLFEKKVQEEQKITVQKNIAQNDVQKKPDRTAQTAQATQGKQEQDKKTAEKKTVNPVKTALGLEEEGISAVRDEKGVIHYYNTQNNKEITGEQREKIVQAEADAVSEALYQAANGTGTDEELLQQGVKSIYSREILTRVNKNLAQRDDAYAGDSQTMPVEALIADEISGTEKRQLLKTLMNSGTMTVDEQSNTVKRELDNAISGKTSYTDLKEVMQLVRNPEVRTDLEKKIKNDKSLSGLKPDDGSYIRAYIKDDGFKPKEVDMLDLELMKTGAYREAEYKKDANGNPVLNDRGKPIIEDYKDQKHRDNLIRRCVFEYKDQETLNKGLESINSNPDSPDYKVLELYSRVEVIQNRTGKYPEKFKGQDFVQRYLAGIHSDKNGKVDTKALSASNTLLYKGEKPPRVQAEEAMYEVQNGDYNKAFKSMEPETYSEISKMIANGDVKGVNNMKDLYNKALSKSPYGNEATEIKANAILSGQIEFSDKEKADFCVELMHSIDNNHDGSWLKNGAYKNAADYQKEQLKAILQDNPEIIKNVKSSVEKGNFSYTLDYDGEAQRTFDTKKEYMELIKDSKHIAKDEIFLDSKGNKITDPKEIAQIKAKNSESLTEMRKYVASLEREHKKQVASEGFLSDMANGLSTTYGFGTDRDDVATEYRNAKLLLNQLEAASQGKLRDSEGNVVSMQDLAKQTVEKEKKLAETNGDYNTTIAYGKTAIVLAPVIAATWGAGAVVASTGGATATAASMAAANGITVPTAVVSAAATAESILVPAAAAGITVQALDNAEAATSAIGLTVEKMEEAEKHGNQVAVETAAFIAAGQLLSSVSNRITSFFRRQSAGTSINSSASAAQTPHTSGSSVPKPAETPLLEYHPTGSGSVVKPDVPTLPKPPASSVPKPAETPLLEYHPTGSGSVVKPDVPALPKPPASSVPKPAETPLLEYHPTGSGSVVKPEVPALPKPPASSVPKPAETPLLEYHPTGSVHKPSFSWEFTIPDYTENLPVSENNEANGTNHNLPQTSLFRHINNHIASRMITDTAKSLRAPQRNNFGTCMPQTRCLDMFGMMNMMNRAMMQNRYNNYQMMQKFALLMIFVYLWSFMTEMQNDSWF